MASSSRMSGCLELPSLKPADIAPENGWLEDDSFPFAIRPLFRCELLVSGRVFVKVFSHLEISEEYLLKGLWEMIG